MECPYTDRVIVLVDMDCFYCQVEEKLNPSLVGKPIAVVQYNAWRGGGIIAVNYPARDMGVTRHMRGHEAKAKCHDINLVRVPTLREKADLTRYRDAGKEVAAVLQIYADVLERASVDEAYLDITMSVNKRLKNGHAITIDQLKNTHVVGCDIKDFINNFKDDHFLENNLKLCIGGVIAEEIRAAVLKKTGYKCSAGIAHNKILAKLACGLHKPNQQTILPQDGVDGLYETLPLRKIKSLGGKFGSNLEEDLRIKTMGNLKNISEKDLINRYDEKNGAWLYKIARGIDLEPVTERLVSKSIGCCKKFPGRTALIQHEDVHHWINELSLEISERLQKDLEENNRKAKHIVVGFVQKIGKKEVSTSRTHPLSSYEPVKIAGDMLKVLNKHCLSTYGKYHLTYLGVSAGKFEDCKKAYDITSFFKTSTKEFSTNSTATNTVDAQFIQIINRPFISENGSPSCNNIAEKGSVLECEFEVNNDLHQTVSNCSHCTKQVILDSDIKKFDDSESTCETFNEEFNTKTDHNVATNLFKINQGINADDSVIQVDNRIINLENRLPSYSDEAEESSLLKSELEAISIEQDILDSNDNYLNSSNSPRNNSTNLSDTDKLDDSMCDEIENAEASNSSSIFSQCTDLFEIDETELIFNTDYKSIEGFYSVLFEDSKSSETDSISDEIKSSCEERHDVPEQNTSSYFSNYFNNRESLNRNFDTSRYLIDDFESGSSNTDNFDRNSDSMGDNSNVNPPFGTPNILEMPKYIKENISNRSITEIELCTKTNEPSTSTPCNTSQPKYDDIEDNFTDDINYTKPFEEAFNDNTKERCKECHKLVPRTEMPSHMDYHYAIKIVRDEAHLYNRKNNVPVVNSPKEIAPVKQTKRKKCESASSTMLASYLETNKEVPSDVPTEICQDCKKKIVKNEFLSHLDYHVAKKLHSEINSLGNRSHQTQTPVTKGSSKKKQTLKQNKHQSVMSFFNQNM